MEAVEHTKRTRAVYTYDIVKFEKRLYLRQRETDKRVYTPPEHVRQKLHGREPMVELAASLLYDVDHPSFIKAIVAFETAVCKNDNKPL